jgi:predicted polyphosphate/ATP-dependent NAD kinase
MLRLGIIVNPIAGIGGPAALKGSDGADIQDAARARGVLPQAGARMRLALTALTTAPVRKQLAIVTWGGVMGADALAGLDFAARVLGEPAVPSSAADTRTAAQAMLAAGIDVLMFAGGDGTARDLAETVPPTLPVIGVPAGVKMHSGVFAVTPRDAGDLLERILTGGLVAVEMAEVRDIDETALREGRVATRYYGELCVPRLGAYLQHVKSGGREVEGIVLGEIAHTIAERLAGHRGLVILGPGSTLLAIKSHLGISGTLLGFDLMRDGEVVGLDVDAAELARQVGPDSVLVITFTRNQGFLIGRGNQQLTPEVLRTIARSDIWVVGSRTKLKSLEGRPLLVDSGAVDVDERLAGVIEIISGYDDVLLYRVGHR